MYRTIRLPAAIFSLVLPFLTHLACADEVRHPVSAKIIPTKEQAVGPFGSESGNVQVTFNDNTTEMWTTNSPCQLPRVAKNGSLVGWTHGKIMDVKSSSQGGQFLGSNKLRVMRGEKVAADFTADTPIRRWEFSTDLKFVYIVDQGLHGPETISRGEIATGQIVASHNSMEENLPAWAKPFADSAD